MRLGLVEASHNQIGSPVDQVLLFCFHYDPAEGKYGAAVMSMVRLGGLLTLIVVAVGLWRLFRAGPLPAARCGVIVDGGWSRPCPTASSEGAQP